MTYCSKCNPPTKRVVYPLGIPLEVDDGGPVVPKWCPACVLEYARATPVPEWQTTLKKDRLGRLYWGSGKLATEAGLTPPEDCYPWPSGTKLFMYGSQGAGKTAAAGELPDHLSYLKQWVDEAHDIMKEGG